MIDLVNHAGMWLRDDAAASLARFELAHGVQPINSAGRTVSEQQSLIYRFAHPASIYDKPPYLFAPAPAEGPNKSRHIDGKAIDTSAPEVFHTYGEPYGWEFLFAYDKVHFEYNPAKDLHINDSATVGKAVQAMGALSNYSIIEDETDSTNAVFVGNGEYWPIAPSWAEHFTGNKSLSPELKKTLIDQGVDYRRVSIRQYDLLNIYFAVLANKKVRARK